MTDLKVAVGRRIALLRKSSGLSQVSAALSASMSRRYLGAVERGERAATLDTLERLARTIGVEPREFFEGIKIPAAPRAGDPAAKFGAVARSLATGVAKDDIKRAEGVLRAFFRGLPREGAKSKRGGKAKKVKKTRQ